MASKSTRRTLAIVVVLIAVLAIGSAVAVQWALHALRSHVEQLLGPTGHADHIDVGFSRITLDGVLIKAPAGWPAQDALRAKRIVLTPDLWQLLSHRVAIQRATLDDAYLSILRTADGTISLLPNLRASVAHKGDAGDAGSSATSADTNGTGQKLTVDVGGIDFNGGTLDFFDGTVAQPPFRLRVEHLKASIGQLHFPALDARTDVSIAGNIVGARSSGPLNIDGWIVFADKRSDIHTRFSQVDVQALLPYIDRRDERKKRRTIEIDSGLVGLDAHSLVQDQRLQANGTITLDDLKLARGDGPISALEAIPREAAIAALKDRQNRISLQFTLEGNLSDPKFSLNEGISTRIAAGLAKALGISAEGVARSVGETTKGLGGALMNLIGK